MSEEKKPKRKRRTKAQMARDRQKEKKEGSFYERKPALEPSAIRGANGQFVKGHDMNRRWTKEEAIREFQLLEIRTRNGEFLTIQEIIMNSEFSPRQFDLLADKYDECKELKETMVNSILAIINRGGMEGTYNPATVIWRNKQLGEHDRQIVETEHKEQPLFSKKALPPKQNKKSLPKGKDS